MGKRSKKVAGCHPLGNGKSHSGCLKCGRQFAPARLPLAPFLLHREWHAGMTPPENMRKFFYTGLAGLAVFEVLKVYFIMPFPGSQRIDSLEFAYLLHLARWYVRIGCLLAIAVGFRAAWTHRPRWRPVVASLLTAGVVWFFNYQMMADHMFLPPRQLVFKARADNVVDENSVVVGVDYLGEARAYPIRYLVYHHQVPDTVGGRPVLVTYCSVCRTGRVFLPTVDGRHEKFRLVGMDHFNAMFEDATTGSWWRQATGEAVTGPRRGLVLPEAASRQLTLRQWFALHPGSLVMQPDGTAGDNYDAEGKFERGLSKGDLTRTDTRSWQDKSWVVGVQAGAVAKAYDWNRLKAERVINDRVGDRLIVLVLATDQQSFAVFERHAEGEQFTIKDDVIMAEGRAYDLAGNSLTESGRRLQPLQANQEFWHSWRTFHPGTRRDAWPASGELGPGTD